MIIAAQKLVNSPVQQKGVGAAGDFTNGMHGQTWCANVNGSHSKTSGGDGAYGAAAGQVTAHDKFLGMNSRLFADTFINRCTQAVGCILDLKPSKSNQ